MTAGPYSPLNLRLVLALAGTVFCLVLGVLVLRAFGAGPSVFLFALAAIGVVDLVVIQRRRHERQRRHRDKGHRHDSLFE
jgi:membrane protein implicated in regulation of membrane protease activity